MTGQHTQTSLEALDALSDQLNRQAEITATQENTSLRDAGVAMLRLSESLNDVVRRDVAHALPADRAASPCMQELLETRRALRKYGMQIKDGEDLPLRLEIARTFKMAADAVDKASFMLEDELNPDWGKEQTARVQIPLETSAITAVIQSHPRST